MLMLMSSLPTVSCLTLFSFKQLWICYQFRYFYSGNFLQVHPDSIYSFVTCLFHLDFSTLCDPHWSISVSIPFFCLWLDCLNDNTFFWLIHSPVDGDLTCSYFRALLNYVAMNICMWYFVWTYVFISHGYILRNGIFWVIW